MSNNTNDIVPITVDEFNIRMFDIDNMKRKFNRDFYKGDVVYNNADTYIQTPELVVGKHCIQRNLNNYNTTADTRLKVFFFDDGSENFGKVCNVFEEIDNKMLNRGYSIFGHRNRYDDPEYLDGYYKLVKKVDYDFDEAFYFSDLKKVKKNNVGVYDINTKYWSTKLDGSIDNLKTSVYECVDGITTLHNPKNVDELSELLPEGSKIRMVMKFDKYVSSNMKIFTNKIVMIHKIN